MPWRCGQGTSGSVPVPISLRMMGGWVLLMPLLSPLQSSGCKAAGAAVTWGHLQRGTLEIALSLGRVSPNTHASTIERVPSSDSRAELLCTSGKNFLRTYTYMGSSTITTSRDNPLDINGKRNTVAAADPNGDLFKHSACVLERTSASPCKARTLALLLPTEKHSL